MPCYFVIAITSFGTISGYIGLVDIDPERS